VGAGIDSYYEYLLKAYIMLGDETYLNRFNKVRVCTTSRLLHYTESVRKRKMCQYSGWSQSIAIGTAEHCKNVFSSYLSCSKFVLVFLR